MTDAQAISDTGQLQTALERVDELEMALRLLDDRLIQCFDWPVSVREAYDTYFQNLVSSTLEGRKAMPAPLSDAEIEDMWIRRDCHEAIQCGDLLKQVQVFARAIEARAKGAA